MSSCQCLARFDIIRATGGMVYSALAVTAIGPPVAGSAGGAARSGRTIRVGSPASCQWSVLEAELPPLARGRVAGNRVRVTEGDRILFRRWCASVSGVLLKCMPVKDAKPLRKMPDPA
jgi:hypothetical protein